MYKLFSINIHFNDIKKFFLKKTKDKNKIIKRRILGISFSYVRAKEYIHFAQILEFIKPYIDEDISELINRYYKMSKLWRISSRQYRKDMDIVKNMANMCNSVQKRYEHYSGIYRQS